MKNKVLRRYCVAVLRLCLLKIAAIVKATVLFIASRYRRNFYYKSPNKFIKFL